MNRNDNKYFADADAHLSLAVSALEAAQHTALGQAAIKTIERLRARIARKTNRRSR